jgi:hypothetical protein
VLLSGRAGRPWLGAGWHLTDRIGGLMNGPALQDRISRGLGAAARMTGTPHDLFRPHGSGNPLSVANRVVRLNASFNAQDPTFARAGMYGRAVWYGVFDAAYARVGDYLRACEDGAVWFVAAIQPLLPILCARAERVLRISRRIAPLGSAAYGGAGDETLLLVDWPASVLAAGEGRAVAQLPSDTRLPVWSVLLPDSGVLLHVGDLVTDDLGRNGVISSAELTEFGWRLLVRQASA